MIGQNTAPLVGDVDDIRLAVVGKLADNDHPYSWSAILNGYDPEALPNCPNPVIRQYLAAQPKANFGIPGVRVTHVWAEDADDATRVARVSRIPNVVVRPEEVIGGVDAVLIPTDKGHEHLERARPFIAAGIPVFIDKPLTDREDHLREFLRWQREGRPLMSSSCMRYAKEFLDCRQSVNATGPLRFITATTCRSWERYGIHAMEAVYQLLPPHGWLSVTNSGTEKVAVAHIRHASNVDVVIAAVDDMDGASGCLSLYGTEATCSARFLDSFSAFKAQLAAFVSYLQTGSAPYPFDETAELMKIIIAGIRSRDEKGRTVLLSELEVETTSCSI
jgi:hypothetical protein